MQVKSRMKCMLHPQMESIRESDGESCKEFTPPPSHRKRLSFAPLPIIRMIWFVFMPPPVQNWNFYCSQPSPHADTFNNLSFYMEKMYPCAFPPIKVYQIKRGAPILCDISHLCLALSGTNGDCDYPLVSKTGEMLFWHGQDLRNSIMSFVKAWLFNYKIGCFRIMIKHNKTQN